VWKAPRLNHSTAAGCGTGRTGTGGLRGAAEGSRLISVSGAEPRRAAVDSDVMSATSPDLAGRTALVTGATGGLGLELGRLLARRRATVLAGCRASARFERARAQVAASDGTEAAARWQAAPADLAVDADVDGLAADLAASGPALDFVFLNAGIHDVPHGLTSDGHERTFAANYLGHFRLLHRLALAGTLAPAARIVTSQSEAVHSNPFARAAIDVLERPESTALGRALWRATASPNTKVLLALMAIEWSRRTAGGALAGTTFVGASPGPLRTGNVEQPGLAMALLRRLAPLLLRPAAAGAELLAWVATEPEIAGRGGAVYRRDRRPVRLRAVARDPETARRAWETTERVLGLPAFPS
jgi:NAD(P)-dependent dehydrogenase (short-subunit alcohol dehydrogenase family)